MADAFSFVFFFWFPKYKLILQAFLLPEQDAKSVVGIIFQSSVVVNLYSLLKRGTNVYV